MNSKNIEGYLLIGAYPDGRPIYAMAGGDGTAVTPDADGKPTIVATPTQPNPLLSDTTPKIEELTSRLKAAVEVMQESKEEDTARWQKANEERQELGKAIHEVKATQERDERQKATDDAVAGMQELLAQTRKPSKAAAIGGNVLSAASADRGAFVKAITQVSGNDAEAQAAGKASLSEMGVTHQEAWGKATLGSTDATGGFIIPNNLVDDIVLPALYQNPYRSLVTVVSGVTTAGVDIPYKSALDTRAVIAGFGTTKDNNDLTYTGYTATMYTLARIYDVGNQFLRQSAGAAETDVMNELSNAFALGEAWYTLNGTGTAMPYGLATAMDNAPATFRSTFTAAATLAGSISASIATAAGALATRNRSGGLSACMSASSYWTMLAEGTDEAGFFFAPASGPTAIPGLAPGTLVSPFGIPVIPDSGFEADDLIVGQYKELKEYVGQSYRVDSSSVAGTRWDVNVTGFRGEMEMGLDARPSVFAGAFQDVADIIP